jgi:thiol:disulfide interchange protein DsbD
VLLLSIWILQRANAQIENPVQWNFSSKKIDSNTYEVHLTASIEGNWHIYSQNYS